MVKFLGVCVAASPRGTVFGRGGKVVGRFSITDYSTFSAGKPISGSARHPSFFLGCSVAGGHRPCAQVACMVRSWESRQAAWALPAGR